ncbi:hypothetical protein Q5P01_000956 [Channa striata]|uniref:Ig-like domain-containing protein n=1 Tax=Channa striata TaxID=64152 RepID=A0AA88IWI6_CHASR|nr:hypothetical protein Q5P01_000956 [Channa striata]
MKLRASAGERPGPPWTCLRSVSQTDSSGVPDLPDFMAAAELDGVRTGYCDSKNRTEVKQDAWKRSWIFDVLRNSAHSHHLHPSQGRKQLDNYNVNLCRVKMKTLFLLFLFCHVSSPVEHSLKVHYTVSSGIPNLPESMMSVLVDDVQAGYCNCNKTIEITEDVWKTLLKDNPGILELANEQCFEILPKLFKSTLDRIMQHLNQTGGVHILQYMESFESDEQTGDTFHIECGYDGEDFISVDVMEQKLISWKPEADVIIQQGLADKATIEDSVRIVTQIYPVWLKLALKYGESFLLRTVRPSVSLLQTSPSSPVSCHATGFYPDRATMFWSKDGEELHEDVDHGEILPNQDGTFQMTVDLDISSVKPEDWTRYNCVVQLYSVKDDIITKLDKAVIRTNWGSSVSVVVGSVLGGLMLLSVFITGLFIWMKKNNVERQRCFYS